MARKKPNRRRAPPPVVPKLLTDAASATIRQAVADGVPLKFAAGLAGVSPRSLFRWLAQGRREDGPAECVALVALLKGAAAEAVQSRIAVIKKAADAGTWTAAAWHLERCHPDHFGTDRRELRELRKAVLDLTERLARLAPRDESKPAAPVGPAA